MSPETLKEAPYVHQEYPKMLYKGGINPAHEEQGFKGMEPDKDGNDVAVVDAETTKRVNNPEEEAIARKQGFKDAPKSTPGTPAEVAAAARTLVESEKALAEASAKLELEQEEFNTRLKTLQAKEEELAKATAKAEEETVAAAGKAVENAKKEAAKGKK